MGASNSLAPDPNVPSAPEWHDGTGTPSPAIRAVAGMMAPAPGRNVPPVGAIFAALAEVRALLSLVPDGPGGTTRLRECVEAMRHTYDEGMFGKALTPIAPSHSAAPISYPSVKLNVYVNAARDVMIRLLARTTMEPSARGLLAEILSQPGDFLEPDDRGTIEGWINRAPRPMGSCGMSGSYRRWPRSCTPPSNDRTPSRGRHSTLSTGCRYRRNPSPPTPEMG